MSEREKEQRMGFDRIRGCRVRDPLAKRLDHTFMAGQKMTKERGSCHTLHTLPWLAEEKERTAGWKDFINQARQVHILSSFRGQSLPPLPNVSPSPNGHTCRLLPQ